MRERTGDIWKVRDVDAVVIPTNGYVNRKGLAVMGRGLAYVVARRWPQVPVTLGELLLARGNHVMDVYKPKDAPTLIGFPVKHKWYHIADLDLIERSALELVALADRLSFRRVALPRVGCGNGQRDWLEEVKPILERHLDDRFLIVSRPLDARRDLAREAKRHASTT